MKKVHRPAVSGLCRPALALAAAAWLLACDGEIRPSNAYPLPSPGGPDGGAGPDGSVGSPSDAGTMPPKVLASLEIRATVTTLAVGQSTVFSVLGRADDGSVVEDVAVEWTSAAPSVVQVESDGTLAALTEGQAEILARAGAIESNRVSLTVLPRLTGGQSSVRIEPDRVVLAPGSPTQLVPHVRDESGTPVDNPDVLWVVGNTQLIDVDARGRLSGIAPGETWVAARFGGTQSSTVGVRVASSGNYLAIDFELPDSDLAAVDSVEIVALVQDLAADSSSSIGLPVQADAVDVLLDGQPIGTLGVDYGRAFGNVSVGASGLGEHELRLRAVRGGDTAVSPPIAVRVISAAIDMWRPLGGTSGAADGEEIDLLVSGDATHVAANQCRRFCQLDVHDYDSGADSWGAMTYQRSEWRDWDGVVEESQRRVSTISLPRFVGWGWTGANSRAPDLLEAEGAPTVAWANEDARRGFNEEEMPERYWFDCYVAEWDTAGGLDGTGGWRLYSPERPDFLWNLPSPDEINMEYGTRDAWRFPEGADRERTLDCDYPQLARDTNGTLLAYLSSPIPGTSWALELRRWDGNTWQDVTVPMPIEGGSPKLTEMQLDSVGRAVVSLVTDSGEGRVLRQQGSSWVEIGTSAYTPPIARVRVTDSGGLVAVGNTSGDAQVYLGGELSWAPLGSRLDVQPWAEVHDLWVHALGSDLFAAWTEGPELGNRNLYVARWEASQATWVVLGGGPAELNPDRSAYDPHLQMRADGTLVIAYSEPSGDPDNPLTQRVLETTMPVTSGR